MTKIYHIVADVFAYEHRTLKLFKVNSLIEAQNI